MISFLPNMSYFYSTIIVVILLATIFFLWRKSPKHFSGGSHSVLSQFSQDLTQMALDNKLDPVIGREEEIERVIQILSRRTKNNPVLIGKPGIGKTAIAEGLAQLIAAKKVPDILKNKKVLSLDLTNIVAGTKYRGEFEKRLKQIADEITASKRNIILFIDEIHTLAEAGGAEGSIDADDILKPALARGDLQVIGATTIEEYKQFIAKDVTLDRRLHPLLIDEPSEEETLDILRGIRKKYEQFHKVKITDEAIKAAVSLSATNVKNKSFPDKAIDLMDESASKVSIDSTDRKKDDQWPEVTAQIVSEVMKEWMENKVF